MGSYSPHAGAHETVLYPAKLLQVDANAEAQLEPRPCRLEGALRLGSLPLGACARAGLGLRPGWNIAGRRMPSAQWLWPSLQARWQARGGLVACAPSGACQWQAGSLSLPWCHGHGVLSASPDSELDWAGKSRVQLPEVVLLVSCFARSSRVSPILGPGSSRASGPVPARAGRTH